MAGKTNTTATETTAEGTKPERKRLTPAEKATKDFKRAEKRLQVANDKLAKFDTDKSALETEQREAQRFYDFAAGSAHLPTELRPVQDEAPASGDQADEETFSAQG